MEYLLTTLLWFIVSLIGYLSFWKDWKKLNRVQQWFIIVNLGFSIFAVVNYFFN